MNALIVDDERLARNELRRLLKTHPDVQVVGEAAHADQAEARLAELQVDLLLLDVQMPGESGFDLLERLERVPTLVFTTAYDECAACVRGQRIRLPVEADPGGTVGGGARQGAGGVERRTCHHAPAALGHRPHLCTGRRALLDRTRWRISRSLNPTATTRGCTLAPSGR